jgi:hypothetical protein
MTKHKRTKRRNQRGGAWYNPMSWFSGTGTEDPDAPKKSIVDTITGATTNAVNSNISDSISSTLNTNVDVTGTQQPTGTQSTGTQSTDVQSQPVPVPMGGKKRRRSRTMKGGKGGLGLTYYASPVSGIKVAQPTTWLNYSTKGGSRRRRTNKRKTHRHKKY